MNRLLWKKTSVILVIQSILFGITFCNNDNNAKLLPSASVVVTGTKSSEQIADMVTTDAKILDPNFSQQWALYNNGTFSVSDEGEKFPVYMNPFQQPIQQSLKKDFDSLYRSMKEALYSEFATVLMNNSSTVATKSIDINIVNAWKEYNQGVRDTVVALIDTGVDYTHEDIKASIWVNEDEIPEDGVDNDQNGYIDDVYGWNFYDNNNVIYNGTEDSHGTHGAGTIVAMRGNKEGIAGIVGNSTVKIMVIKALGGKEGSGLTEAIVKAIQYAEANGADICNLSFGTGTDDASLRSTIEDSNMLFIAAAGNGDHWTGKGINDDQRPIYPAAYDFDNIISVANLNYNGKLHYSSNYGNKSVDIAAPGSYILSTTPNNTYSYMSGTSMAAPMVTGVAAMIYSHYNDVTLTKVKEMILKSAKPLDALNGYITTGGMLDAYAALTYDDIKASTSSVNISMDESNSQELTAQVESAPHMSATITYSKLDEKILVLDVQDLDDDLKEVYIGSGILNVEDFDDLTLYTKVNMDENHQALFRIVYGGTYTFYAVDHSNHASVYSIKLTAE